MEKLVTFWRVTGHLLWLGAAVAAGAYLNHYSFVKIREMRQLERIPRTAVIATLPGEINLAGQAVVHERTVQGPRSGRETLYFRYIKEREETDSDGDKHWRTLEDRSDWVPFLLEDTSGRVRLEPSSEVRFHAAQKLREREGNLRYTEYRIDPGEGIFVFGYAERNDAGFHVGFSKPGEYVPIISSEGEVSERRGMATVSVFAAWGALLCLSLAVVAICSLFEVHQIFYYLSFVALVMVAALLYTGLGMLKAELVAAHERASHHEGEARQAFSTVFERHGIAWDGAWKNVGDLNDAKYAALEPWERERLRRIRIDLVRSFRRTNGLRAMFPSNYLAPLWGVPHEREPILPPDDAAAALELDSEFQRARLSGGMSYPVLIAAALAAIGLSWWGFRRVKVKRYIENIPTSPTPGVVYGLSEVKGTVETLPGGSHLDGPLTGIDCVHYHYIVKEKRSSGKKTKWVTIENRTQGVPFLCRDEQGSLEVRPEGATVYSRRKNYRHSGNRKYYEWTLALGDRLYALGSAEIEPEEMDKLVLTAGNGEMPFILSNKPEQDVMFGIGRWGMLILNFALGAVILTALMWFGLQGAFSAVDYLGAAAIALLYLGLLYCIFVYNDIVFMHQRVRRDWHNIDVAMKKRADLIPRLEQVVKGYFAHEKGVLEGITQLREKYSGGGFVNPAMLAEYLRAEENFMKSFVGLVEKYPDLKGNQQSAALMDALVKMENEVAMMREGYNDAVASYNKRILALPEVVFAKIGGFSEADYLRGEKRIREAPQVALATT